MVVNKILLFNVVCSHCGTKICMTYDEYKKFCEKTEGFGGSEITCMEEIDGKKREITYVNFECPTCHGYIPMTALDGVESDKNGFKVSNCVKPLYEIDEEVSIDDYLKDWFGEDSEVDENSEF